MAETIALTGATGFIGERLLERLLEAGYRVRALVRRPDALQASDVLTPVLGDLNDPVALGNLVEGVAAVVHGAGLIRARRTAEFEAVNAGGTRRLAAACVAAAPTAPFILLSSLAAREPALSAYGASKRQAEAALSEGNAPARWIALRPPAVYGPGDRATLALFRQLSRPVAFVPTVREQRLSLIHVDDLTQAVLALLKTDSFENRAVEIHDGRIGGYGWPDLARAASAPQEGISELGAAPRLLYLPRAAVSALAAVNGLLAALTGSAPLLGPGKVAELYHSDWVCTENPVADQSDWYPRIQAERGFPSTLAWYKSQDWL